MVSGVAHAPPTLLYPLDDFNALSPPRHRRNETETRTDGWATHVAVGPLEVVVGIGALHLEGVQHGVQLTICVVGLGSLDLANKTVGAAEAAAVCFRHETQGWAKPADSPERRWWWYSTSMSSLQAKGVVIHVAGLL